MTLVSSTTSCKSSSVRTRGIYHLEHARYVVSAQPANALSARSPPQRRLPLKSTHSSRASTLIPLSSVPYLRRSTSTYPETHWSLWRRPCGTQKLTNLMFTKSFLLTAPLVSLVSSSLCRISSTALYHYRPRFIRAPRRQNSLPLLQTLHLIPLANDHHLRSRE